MFTAQQYVKAATLEEAWQLNQKRSTTLLAGGCWLRLTRRRVGALVDLSGWGWIPLRRPKASFRWGLWSPCASWRQTKP